MCQSDTLIIYHGIGSYHLTDQHKSDVDQFFKEHEEKTSIRLIASADFLGNIDSNKILSDRRLKEIEDLLTLEYSSKIESITSVSTGEIIVDESKYDRSIGILQDRVVKIIATNLRRLKHYPSSLTQLMEAELGSTVIIEYLNFQPGRHRLLRESIPVLHDLVRTLKEATSLHIRIEGHICCLRGTGHDDGRDIETGKYDLSLARAKDIYDYLIKKGIGKSRLSIKGYGYSKPLVYPERNPEDARKNRRVEIKIVKK